MAFPSLQTIPSLSIHNKDILYKQILTNPGPKVLCTCIAAPITSVAKSFSICIFLCVLCALSAASAVNCNGDKYSQMYKGSYIGICGFYAQLNQFCTVATADREYCASSHYTAICAWQHLPC
jgi:hypothetical protein